MEYYKVIVTIMKVGNCSEHKEEIFFKSLFAARHMAKEYFACADVQEVVVTNGLTGEVMYSNDYTNGEFISYD